MSSKKVSQVGIPQSSSVVHYRIHQVKKSSCHLLIERGKQRLMKSWARERSGNITSNKSNQIGDKTLTGKADQAVKGSGLGLVQGRVKLSPVGMALSYS